MRVEQLMSSGAASCRADENLSVAALRMWDNDCGVLPVVDDGGHVQAVITDRDICMATALKGKAPAEIKVAAVVNGPAYACSVDADSSEVLELMRDRQVRRLPVIDREGRLCGVISLNDLVLAARAVPGTQPTPTYRDVMDSLQGVCAHRSLPATLESETAPLSA